ncbi:MAG: serine/threonine protein kinase [Polyangiaceae bacterium]|nr:serine/threonine protein kinase [Polyangiaceae bacterium]
MKATELAQGTLLGDKFCIVRLLGQGGMGSVYEVEHRRTGKRCALKLLHPHVAQSNRMVARFWREVAADGKIGNPHIIQVHDAGVLSSGEPYLMMELLSGETLAERIRRKPSLGLMEICEIMGQVCEAVQAAHDAKIIHRDLKPQNLFLTTREGKPFVKVLDFGISKLVENGATLTSPGVALGTPAYMPPEQLLGWDTVDERSDIYSLGVILYECATGRRPFQTENPTQLGVRARFGKPQPVSVARPDLPESFCNLVARAMAVEKSGRFVSARELGEALDRVCDPKRDTVVDIPVGADLNLSMGETDLLESTMRVGLLESQLTLPSPPEPSSMPGVGPAVPYRSLSRWGGVKHPLTLFGLLGVFLLSVVILHQDLSKAVSTPSIAQNTSLHETVPLSTASGIGVVPVSTSSGNVPIPAKGVTPVGLPNPGPPPKPTGSLKKDAPRSVPKPPQPSTLPPDLPEPEPVKQRT